jgi:hypothetical protein
VSSAEKIGGLIVNEALLQGERQLLRDRNPTQQDAKGAPAPPAAPPISHSDKAMAPVLLTLLDEQLNGTLGDDASRMGARPGEISSPPNRVAARYAEDDRVFRADLTPNSTSLPQGQTYPHIAQMVPSPDLQDFLHRAMTSKTRNMENGAGGFPGPLPQRKASGGPVSGASSIKVAGIVIGVTAVLMLLAVKWSR